ncbi:MAG: OB-fold domain-containing protein [Deltaproteobacteria bacterium]|nr:OB-fold domain-containing protein [Deltaproteobacteria bacterium]
MTGDRARGLRPLPEPDDDLVAAFWEHCAQGRLCFQRCTECGAWRHLPRVLCAQCGSAQFQWSPSSGRGRIFSWTVTHQPLVRDFPEPVPYAVVVVELEEGVRMVAGLRGLAPAELSLDLPVEVVFETVAEGSRLPFFRPRKP